MELFIADRKATKGLTPKGERWLRQTLGTFTQWTSVPLTDTERAHIIRFLAQWEHQPWQKHSMYRALRTFCKWLSLTYNVPNPFVDQWGNHVIDAPKTPSKVLYTMTPEKVRILLEEASTTRDKSIIALLADSGARQSEIASIQAEDVDLVHRRIKVWGKGQKEGYIVFGGQTAAQLEAYVAEAHPTGSLFGLTAEGLKTMLQRLGKRTGIHCNTHSFRRGFATSLRRQGIGALDIKELGRWSSVAMVERYTRAYTFDDAVERYKPIVR